MKKLLLISFILSSFLTADYFSSAIAEDLSASELNYKTICISTVLMITGEENDTTRLYRARLETDLSAENKFSIVDRQKTGAVFQEIELAQSGMTSDEVSLETGKTLSAQAILAVEIADLEAGRDVYVKVVEVETGRLAYSQVYRDYTPADETLKSQKEVKVLKVNEKDKQAKINGQRKNPQHKYHAFLAVLKIKDPAKYMEILDARKKFQTLTNDEKGFLIFLTYYKHSRPLFKKHAPRLLPHMEKESKKAAAQNPKKAQYVKQYMNKYGPVIDRDPEVRSAVNQAVIMIIKKFHRETNAQKKGGEKRNTKAFKSPRNSNPNPKDRKKR